MSRGVKMLSGWCQSARPGCGLLSAVLPVPCWYQRRCGAASVQRRQLSRSLGSVASLCVGAACVDHVDSPGGVRWASSPGVGGVRGRDRGDQRHARHAGLPLLRQTHAHRVRPGTQCFPPLTKHRGNEPTEGRVDTGRSKSNALVQLNERTVKEVLPWGILKQSSE